MVILFWIAKDKVLAEAVQSYLDITCPPTMRLVPTS